MDLNGMSGDNFSSNFIEFQDFSKFLIRKNMKGILDSVLEEISDFKQPLHLKLKSISVLFYLVKACGVLISPYLEKILYCLYVHIDNEEEISKRCEETAQIIGLCTDQNVVVPLIVKHLSEMEIKNSYQPLYCRLKVLSCVVSKIANVSNETVTLVLRLMNNLDVFNFAENNYIKQILFFTFKIYQSFVYNLGKESVRFHSDIFFPLLLLQSLPDTTIFHQDVKIAICHLAESCGFRSIEELYSLELSLVLEKFRDSHKQWRRNSPDRFAFDTYVRNGGAALDKHWIDVLMIVSKCSEPEFDIEIRMDMIILLDSIIDNPILQEQVKTYVEYMIPEIFIPATSWRAARPNYKVRKAAMVCIIKLFKNNMIEEETANNFFKDILNVLKSTLEDDWDPELRFLSINLLKYLLSKIRDIVTSEQLVEVYPNLIKRLDDSQDSNRIQTCDVFVLFFQIAKNKKISESIYDYIITTSFIHLDDSNENVRVAVYKFLIEASKIYTDIFRTIAEKNLNNFTHKSILRDLIENIN
jgi:hypothetical protein